MDEAAKSPVAVRSDAVQRNREFQTVTLSSRGHSRFALCTTWSALTLHIPTYRCRQRRVRCSGFETGAPCDSCRSSLPSWSLESETSRRPDPSVPTVLPTGIRRKAICVIGQDSYPPSESARTVVFIAVLPPPPPPASSPHPFLSTTHGALDMSLLEEKLRTSG